MLQKHVGEDRLDSLVYAVLGGTLLMVGIITLARALILRNLIEERDRFDVERRHKVAAVVIGATTGFVIGITSAGSGTVIAILLIAVYRLSPKKVVGTDVFHAAILLSAAASPTGSAATSTSASPATSWSARCPGSCSAPLSPTRPRRASSAPRSASSCRLRHRHVQERRPDRLADRRRRRGGSGSAGSSPLRAGCTAAATNASAGKLTARRPVAERARA